MMSIKANKTILKRTTCELRSSAISGADAGFGQGGPAYEVKSYRCNGVGSRQPGSRALEAFGFLMLKYVFSHIVEALLL